MGAPTAAPVPLASRVFDGGVLALGVVIFVGAVATLLTQGDTLPWLHLFSVPLIVLISRFPLLLDRGDGGIEIGFDSSVLMFLICTLPPAEALVLWSLGVIASQVTNDKRPASKRFNVGVGILGGAVATAIITGLRGDVLGTPRELLAVALGATCYFATDFLATAISVGLEERSSIRRQLVQPGTAIAVVCFVPFDSLGYLAAVVVRSAPWWTAALLAVPLVTLLIATRAVTRGRENARRLSVLFEAAVRTQTLPDTGQVVDTLIDDARRLLRLSHVEVRSTPPEPQEIGAQLRDGQNARWIVAPVKHRARSTSAADQQALEAMAAVSSDAFARLRLTEEMTHLARHDLLTGLPNRGLLLDRVEHALRLSRRQGRSIALLFCDLDGFKRVNDRFGHAAGDAVLVDVAQRLAACVRDTDTVARLGGDEFAVLLEDVRPDQVDAACGRILEALRPGAHVAGHQLPLSTSIGVALGHTGHSAEHLLRNADMAMYEAKALGKDQYVQYEVSLGRSRVQRLELVESLRAAVDAGELRLAYQPVVRLDDGRVTGVEALARWTSDGVSVPPDVFISAAEESGLVVALGELVLDLAAADADELRRATDGDLNIGVNISAQQLRSPMFVEKVEETAARMPGVTLTLEVTERDFVNNEPAALEAMQRLSAQGVRFAIDDFGVGFSSIGYLQQMPVNVIKTDASFSAGVDHDERSCGLLRSIMVMGQALGLEVVVEGVERESQMVHVRDHVGATSAQGFLLHRPMSLREVVDVLRTDGDAKEPAASQAGGQRVSAKRPASAP
ncbi:MAG TPA: EAL domain-containing protein [Nocardioidaceae bacterium]|nr:EAL domain-containing protein [Nocardioidaceae bacterium]